MVRTVAALYVAKGGPYEGLPGVECWTVERDARAYAGPHPVVAHPPCARWGRYWSGGPSAKVRRELGDDGGCFAAALAAVRRWGGVLEHPEAPHAWRWHGLVPPPKTGWWMAAGDFIGWTCCVEQGHYGHRARKATWLYAARVSLPGLQWGPARDKARLDSGYHSSDERRTGSGERERITAWECLATPEAFRDVLLAIARTADQPQRET